MATSKELFEVAKRRMFTAVSAYYVWKSLSNSFNVNSKGKAEAEKNVGIINKYQSFFQQTLSSVYKSFVADLSIFFDSDNKYEETFSVSKMIDSLSETLSEGEIEKLKAKIKEIKSRHGVTIALLLQLRNADVAHQEIEAQSRTVEYGKIEELFNAVSEILNLASHHIDNSVWIWDHLEYDVENDIRTMLANLERGEKARLQEIEEKYKDL